MQHIAEHDLLWRQFSEADDGDWLSAAHEDAPAASSPLPQSTRKDDNDRLLASELEATLSAIANDITSDWE